MAFPINFPFISSVFSYLSLSLSLSWFAATLFSRWSFFVSSAEYRHSSSQHYSLCVGYSPRLDGWSLLDSLSNLLISASWLKGALRLLKVILNISASSSPPQSVEALRLFISDVRHGFFPGRRRHVSSPVRHSIRPIRSFSESLWQCDDRPSWSCDLLSACFSAAPYARSRLSHL